MTKQEVAGLLGWVIANFPSLQEKDMRPTATLWYEYLSEVPLNVAKMAVKKVMAVNKFFPQISEIMEAIVELTTPKQLSPIEAWGEVRKALSIFNRYDRGSVDRAYSAVSPVTAKVIKNIGLQELSQCDYTTFSVLRSSFMKQYEIEAQREKQLALMPPDVRQFIEQQASPLIGHTESIQMLTEIHKRSVGSEVTEEREEKTEVN
jgi:hypothetical protein